MESQIEIGSLNKNTQIKIGIFQRFRNFLAYINDPNGEKNTIVAPSSRESNELNEIQKAADTLIKRGQLEDLSRLMRAGYVCTRTQVQAIDSILNKTYFEDNKFNTDINGLGKLIENGFIFSEEINRKIITALFYDYNAESFLKDNLNVPDFNQQLKTYIKKERDAREARYKEASYKYERLDFDPFAFSMYDIEKTQKSMEDLEPILKYSYHYIGENPKEMIKIWMVMIEFSKEMILKSRDNKVSFVRKSDYADMIKDMYNTLIKDIIDNNVVPVNRNMLYKYLSNVKEVIFKENDLELDAILNNLAAEPVTNLEVLIEKTKVLYPNQDLEVLKTDNSMNYLIKYEKAELTDKIKNYLQEIYENFKVILENQESLNMEDILTTNIMFKKRVPEILESLCSFNQEDRVNMKNHDNKSPTDLCEEALDNILSHFAHSTQIIKEDKLSRLSSMTRYTKNFRR